MSTRDGHPFLFVMALGTLIAALVNGDLSVAALMLWATWWTLTR